MCDDEKVSSIVKRDFMQNYFETGEDVWIRLSGVEQEEVAEMGMLWSA